MSRACISSTLARLRNCRKRRRRSRNSNHPRTRRRSRIVFMERSGLLTDLYELTMAAGYFEAGRSAERATFELSIRRLPKNREYVLLAGLEQALEYLLQL